MGGENISCGTENLGEKNKNETGRFVTVYSKRHSGVRSHAFFSTADLNNLVLLSVSTVGFGFVLDMGFFETIKLLLWVVFIDCVGVGLLIATLMW